MNLLTGKQAENLDYWCTWSTQNFQRDAVNPDATVAGEDRGQNARKQMNEQRIFGPNGWSEQFAGVRSQLYFMLDDGWDVPYTIDKHKEEAHFGSFELNQSSFPSFTGDPAARLGKLNAALKARGWKGLGLWLPAMKQDEDFWRARLAICQQAKIRYWKCDWGEYDHDVAFRKWLTDLAQRVYPELVIEHANPVAPLNFDWNVIEKGGNGGRFADQTDCAAAVRELTASSAVVRSYDVLQQLGFSETLDRLASMLKSQHAIINCEDEVYLGAALGASFGIMRSNLWADQSPEYDPYHYRRRIAEVARAVNWHRLAPAFSGGSLAESSEVLTDSWHFEPGQTWFAPVSGRTIQQPAPAVLLRNLSLQQVQVTNSGVKPFVFGSRQPNGAVAIACGPRAMGDHYLFPKAQVILTLNAPAAYLGVFGEFAELTLKGAWLDQVQHVWIQDLAGEQAVEITKKLQRQPGSMYLSQSLLEVSIVRDPGDESAPAVVLAFK